MTIATLDTEMLKNLCVKLRTNLGIGLKSIQTWYDKHTDKVHL